MFILLLLLSVPPASSASVLAGSMAMCAQPLDGGALDIHGDPDEFEDKLKSLQAQKRSQCAAAEQALANQENEVARLQQAVLAMTPEELLRPARKAESKIDSELLQVQQGLARLRAVPNEPSQTSSAELRVVDSLFENSQSRQKQMDADWDKMNRAEEESPLAKLLQLAASTNLSDVAADAIRDFIGRLPPFLSGHGAAPRQKVYFLAQRIHLAQLAAKYKNLDYTDPLRKDLGSSLHEGLSDDTLASRAGAVRLALLDRFGSDNPQWSLLIAKPQGACRLAKETMFQQQRTLKEALKLASGPAQAALKKILQPDIDERANAVAKLRCSPLDISLLTKSLETQERKLVGCYVLPTSKLDLDGIRNDIGSWLQLVRASASAADREEEKRLGEDLWNIARVFLHGCQQAQP